MRVTLSWLREFVDFDLTAQELADKLDLSGTAVESITHLGTKFDKMVVGEVVSVEPHPNADRLRVCRVNVGNGELTIVCGAPNVAPGQKVPVALVGALMPSGLQIQQAKLRGVTSNGMICSEIELELGGDAAGIMVLPAEARVGRPLARELGLDDWVLELEITPNRPDCMSIIGVAREVAALVGARIRVPEPTVTEVADRVGEKAKIEIADPDLCPRYCARYVDNVTIGPSPVWMRQRLEAVGIRSINNVVDVTNYVLIETGQPLHAFDFKLLKGGRIVVRRATDKEELETIDHVVRKLEGDMLVIADGERAVALAGVMGGAYSEINDSTTEVLIESANFNAPNIRKTSRGMGLISESSLRFERGVDVGGALRAADRAAQLIAETAGGRVWSGIIDDYPGERPARVITLRPERVNQVLGIKMTPEAMSATLESIELTVDKVGVGLDVGVPTFRVDLEREVDLIEEVARLHGLNNIPSTILAGTDSERGLNPLQRLTRTLRSLMAGAGLVEVVNYSFIGAGELERLSLPGNHPWMAAVPIKNPLSEDQALLRTNLLPSLLRAVTHNYNRGQKDVSIFEIGNVFGRGDKLPEQTMMLGGALTGERRPVGWRDRDGLVDFYDAKGLIEFICARIRLRDFHVRPADIPVLQPGQAAELVSQDTVIGFFGALHPQIQENHDLRRPVFVFQLIVGELLDRSGAAKTFSRIPRFPAVELDLAFVVAESVTWDNVKRLAFEVGAPLLREVRLFDLYRGEGIAEGKKSLAFSLTYQADDRTLTDDEVALIQSRLIKRANQVLGAELRD